MTASAEDLPLFTGEIEIDPLHTPAKRAEEEVIASEAGGLDWQQVLSAEFADNLFALGQANRTIPVGPGDQGSSPGQGHRSLPPPSP